jgi:hypothetical protein
VSAMMIGSEGGQDSFRKSMVAEILIIQNVGPHRGETTLYG